MKALLKINDIPEFEKPNVHVRDEQELLRKINKIIADGHTKLQIVTDFDHTMTRHTMDNGVPVLTSFGMFRECPSTPQHYKDEDTRLSAIYKPIEADPAMPLDVKIQHMIDWYVAAHKILKNITFPRNELTEIAKKMVNCFRQGVSDLISWSVKQQVPVLVFSAGLGESVTAALKAADYLLPNVKVCPLLDTSWPAGASAGVLRRARGVRHCSPQGSRLPAAQCQGMSTAGHELASRCQCWCSPQGSGSPSLQPSRQPTTCCPMSRYVHCWTRAGQQVPVLVFSAGLGESVTAALKAADYLLPNVKVCPLLDTSWPAGASAGVLRRARGVRHCSPQGSRLPAAQCQGMSTAGHELASRCQCWCSPQGSGSPSLQPSRQPTTCCPMSRYVHCWTRAGQQVPVLVFSAGLGESVTAALKAADYLLPNVKVVSNFLEFDEQDRIIGIKGEVIHTYNKNETAIKGTDYYEMVKSRSNVILMGDNIGDAGMAEGMEHCDVVIKVGFLGHKAEGNLENYLNKFDIVLVNEPTMDVVNAILKRVL
ncbi:hypothetical protein O0L34_g8646 [Tuta absoluta]|nr:hypothetical protein O0L34_g8646 [Tuta absoluta]